MGEYKPKNRASEYRRNIQAEKIHLNLKNKFRINQKLLRHEALFRKRDLISIIEKDLKNQNSKNMVRLAIIYIYFQSLKIATLKMAIFNSTNDNLKLEAVTHIRKLVSLGNILKKQLKNQK